MAGYARQSLFIVACSGIRRGLSVNGRVVEILTLTSLALQLKGEMQMALATLGRAITPAQPGGFVRLFIDEGEPMRRLLTRLLAQKPTSSTYMRALLGAMAPETLSELEDMPRQELPTASYPLLEPLSTREMEVLTLLAFGSSNQEIATHLVIAPNTARRHVKNILARLASTNRTQAVARAREAGLLAQA